MAFDVGSSFGWIAGVGKGVGIAIPYLIGFAIVAGLGVWWYFERQYNKKVVLFKIAGSGYRLIQDKAKLIRDDKGVPFWRLKALKRVPDVPPDSCMIASGAGEVAFGYITSLGEITWCSPEYNPENILKIVKEQGEDALDKTGKGHYEFLKTFKPITTTQRASLAYQLQKANSEVKVDWKQHIPLIVSGLVLLMTLAIFMMFFGKVMEPIISAANTVNAGKTVDLQIVQTLERIEQRMQVLDGNPVANEGNPPPR